jgi:hypothetical protein
MQIRKSIYALCICLLAVGFAHAADTVVVRKDPRVDILSGKQIQANKKGAQLTSSGLYKGFRIQVISTRSRDQAFDTKAMLNTNFPDHKAYVMYQSPNFKVRIGNFLRREDAENFRKEMARMFTEGLYIVEDTVEYSIIEDEETILQ